MSIVLPSRTISAPWLKDELSRRARAAPSLDLQFADRKSLVDAVSGQNLITFTRSSNGTYVDSQGVLQTAATNEPRFDHNPTTGECLGLLVEEQRSNEVRNSNNISAVVTGSPGTLPTGWIAQANTNGWTREVVGSGSLGALNYVDIRFYGTPSASLFQVRFQEQGVVAASNGQAWAASVYHQLVGGSLGNVIGYPAANLWDSSVAFIGSLSTPGTIVPTASLRRYTGSSSISLASAAFVSWSLAFTCTVGNTYDFTLRFAAPQLEAGAFPTSYIPTTGSAATRAADVASITGTSFSSWYRQDEGTVFAHAINPAISTTIFTISDGSINNRIAVDSGTNSRVARVVSSGVLQASSSLPYTYGASQGFAMSYRGNSINLANAGALGTEDTSASIPGVNRITIGTNPAGGGALNSCIRRLTYWPSSLSNATLQAITL